MDYINDKRTSSIESKLRHEKYERIGKAVLTMNYWQRLWWALTGRCKYMKRTFWDKAA